MIIERRQAERECVDIRLNFRHKGLLGIKEGTLQVLDVSPEGLGVRSEENWGRGSPLEIIMGTIIIPCKIVYKERSSYGLIFIDKIQENINQLMAACKKEC